MSTTKPWATKVWKKRRDEILKVRNRCEWCGLTQRESLEMYEKGLCIDHVKEYSGRYLRWVVAWKKVAWELYQKQPGAELRRGRGGGDPEGFKEFKKIHKLEIGNQCKQLMSSKFAMYMEMRDEDIQVLCPRCNMAKTKGMVLCQKCGQHYHCSRYDACYWCNKDKIKSYSQEEERIISKCEEHERQFLYGEKHPELRHLRLWNCEECGEPIDFEHFCGYQCCDVCLELLKDEDRE